MSTPAEQVPAQDQTEIQTPESQTGATEQQQLNRETLDPTVAQYLQSLESQLREQYRERKELYQKVSQIDTRLQEREIEAIDPEEEKKKFYENPMGVIRDEMRKIVQPLFEEARQLRAMNERGDKLTSAKSRVRGNPAVAQYWTPDVESAVDQILSSGNVEINDDTVLAATVQAVGMSALSGKLNIKQADGAPAVTPAHVRIQNPTAPKTPDNTPQRPPLTEHERFMMRMNGIKTEEEWHQFMTAPASEITTNKIGIVENKK